MSIGGPTLDGIANLDCDYLNGIPSQTISYLDATSSIQKQINTLSLSIVPGVKVVNGNFDAVLVPNYINASGTGYPMTGWTNSGNLQTGGLAGTDSGWILGIPITLGQYYYVVLGSTNLNWTTSQAIYFPFAKTYTLSFYAIPRIVGYGYTTNNQITATITGATGSLRTTLPSTSAPSWIKYSGQFIIPSV